MQAMNANPSYIDSLKDEAAVYRSLSVELEQTTRAINAAADALAEARRELFGDL